MAHIMAPLVIVGPSVIGAHSVAHVSSGGCSVDAAHSADEVLSVITAPLVMKAQKVLDVVASSDAAT